MEIFKVVRESTDSVQARHDAAISENCRRRRELIQRLDLRGLEEAIGQYVDLTVYGTKPVTTITVFGKVFVR